MKTAERALVIAIMMGMFCYGTFLHQELQRADGEIRLVKAVIPHLATYNKGMQKNLVNVLSDYGIRLSQLESAGPPAMSIANFGNPRPIRKGG